eukprot:UN32406
MPRTTPESELTPTNHAGTNKLVNQRIGSSILLRDKQNEIADTIINGEVEGDSTLRNRKADGTYQSIKMHTLDVDHIELSDKKSTDTVVGMEKILVLDEMDEFREVMKELWRENWTTRFGIMFTMVFIVICICVAQTFFKTLLTTNRPFATPTTELNERDFYLVVNLVIWFMCLTTGISAEMFIGTRLVLEINNKQLQWLWVYAQMVFSLLLMIAFVAQSAYGMLFGVVGLFKCGFPETISYFHRACNSPWNTVGCWSDFINGVSLLIHHSGVMYLCVAVNLHYYPYDKHLTICSLILMLSHTIVVLKYFHFKLYVVCELIIDAWLQW